MRVPLLDRAIRRRRDALGASHHQRATVAARRQRREARRGRRLLAPIALARQVVFSRPLWRIGRAPVAPGVSIAPAVDVTLELPAGGSSTRHAIPGAARLTDDMPAPELRRRVWSLSAP